MRWKAAGVLVMVLAAACAKESRRGRPDGGEGRVLSWSVCADEWRTRPVPPSITTAAGALGDLFAPGERAEAAAILDEILRKVHDSDLANQTEGVPRTLARRWATWLAELLPRVPPAERRKVVVQLLATLGSCGRSSLDLYHAAFVLAHPTDPDERLRSLLSPGSKEILQMAPSEADILATARELDRELEATEKHFRSFSPQPHEELVVLGWARDNLKDLLKWDFSHLIAALCRARPSSTDCPHSTAAPDLRSYDWVLSNAYGARSLWERE